MKTQSHATPRSRVHQLTLSLSTAALLCGCAAEGDLEAVADGGDTERTEETEGAAASSAEPESDLVVVARFEKSPTNFVEFLTSPVADVGNMLAIGVSYPDVPMVAGSFMENHSVLEAFLAVAPADEAVPAQLRLGVDDAALAALVAPTTRSELRAANSAQLARLPAITAAPRATEANSCSQSFRNWVDGVWRNGFDPYGAHKDRYGACGQSSGHSTVSSGSFYYCSDPACDDDVDFLLGESEIDACSPSLAAAGGCIPTARSTVGHRRQRLLDYGNDGSLAYPGYHQHYGLANCSGGNGAVEFRRHRGGSTSSWSSVPLNGMLHYYWGGDLPSSRLTRWFVSGGSWDADLGEDENGSWLGNQIEWRFNTGANDRIVVCGDVQRSISVVDASNGCSLCDDGANDCFGNFCYD